VAKVLITGVAGFIGSHLARALVDRGDSVRGLDNFATGKRENLTGVALELLELDLRDADGVKAACAGMDYILHEGALPSVPRSVEDPVTSHAVNLNGTLNVLAGAKAAGVQRVVFAASSSAYGNQPGFPRVETMVPMPMAPYPVQKVAGEMYMQSYWRVYGLETVCLRYFNIFGPRQDAGSQYSGVMARFIQQMLKSEQPMIFGDGEQGRDFTYVANVVEANLLALSAASDQVAGRVFNVACGERHTLNETYRELAELIGFALPPQYGPERRGDVKDSLADIGAVKSAMGYEPTVGFREGLRRTVDWYREELAR
jgi:UDP-glucose 4-epimerase